MASPVKDYRQEAAIAQKRRAEAIAAYFTPPKVEESQLPNNLTEYALKSGYYTPEELEIIQTDAEDILAKIANRTWKSLTVTKAFAKAAAYAQELTNCLTEILFTEGFERAQYLDDYLEKTGKTVGPLHGLPISLKDCMVTAPHPSSVGLAALANQPTDKDTLLVTLLRDLGAVFYVKTNIPVAMMMSETINNVFGETRNALHKALSCGGSSGGEGALIAFKGSPLGIGTDIGGSIRIPAAWSYMYGLKPSFGRFPAYGTRSGIPGQEFILAVNGPMSTSLKTLQLYSEAVLGEKHAPWTRDHKVVPIPWRKNVIQPPGRKLRFGIISDHDNMVHGHPPVERALQMTRKALEAQGHEVIDWKPDGHVEIIDHIIEAFHTFGGTAIIDHTSAYGEPVFPSMKGFEAAAKAGEKELGPTKLRNMTIKRNTLQQAYTERWTNSAVDGKGPVDGIIQAVAPQAAPRLGGTQHNLHLGYTGVWNYLDAASCTFPVTFADKNIDKPRDLATFQAISDRDRWIQEDYDPELYHGAPVSLQCAGRRLEEEKVLEMVEVISNALKQAK
ncbi:hypothetical protein DV738_g4254, partial [Chaetothyriales sp. CBS 135597]